eukprot:EG_transcript_5834
MMDLSAGASNPGVAPPSQDSIRELEERLRRRSGGPVLEGPVPKRPCLSPPAAASPSACRPVSPPPGAPSRTEPPPAPMDLPEELLNRLEEALAKEKREKEQLKELLAKRDQELGPLKTRLHKLQEAFVEKVRQACQAERDQEKQEAHHKHFSLGQVVVQRDLSEAWRDGKDLQEARQRRDRIKDELEQVKRQLTDRRKEERKKGRSAAEEEECSVEEEVFSLSLLQSNLQKEEQMALAHLEELEVQKHIFIKDIRRMHSEDVSSFRNFPILNDRYLLERLLGKGGFSEVYKAFDLVECRPVACKIHQLNSNWSEERKNNYMKHARREYAIHKTLVHPRVIQLYDMFEIDVQTFATILEYCDGVDLDLYLKKSKCVGEKEAKVIIYQVFSGLKYLHERAEPVIHYDLKPGNILVSRDMKVKITDFGLSKVITAQDETQIDLTSQGAGTYWYLPPECFQTAFTPKISPKVDVWGAAVVFYQLLFGQKPFGNDVSQQQLVQNQIILNAHKVKFPSKPLVSDVTKDFISRLLCHNQDERPDIFAVCADPYFTAKPAPRRRSMRGDPQGGPPPTV